MIALRILAFGQLETPTWGVAWLADSGSLARLAVSGAANRAGSDCRLESAEPDQAWRLSGDGVALVFTPAGPPGHGGPPDGGLASLDQLCTVSGRVNLGGTEAELECLGWRSVLEGEADLGALDSLRWLAGWFVPHEGFSLTALRPGRARGHDADVVAATLIDDPPPPRVVDPRLSTTYGEAGLPARAGLELWLEPADDEASEDAAPHQYPRRAAGEAIGSALKWEAPGFELHAELLRWHSHGQVGTGVYLLGRRQ